MSDRVLDDDTAAYPVPGMTPRPEPPAPPERSPVRVLDEPGAVLSLVRRVAMQSDLATSLRVLGHGMAELVTCIRVHCLTSDPLTGAPWSAGADADSMASLTAYHRQQICAQPAATCPVYIPDVDNPGGTGREKILAHPILAGEVVVAVLLAIRGENDPMFTQREGALMAAVGGQVGPLLLSAVHAAIARNENSVPSEGLFREQALERHRSQRRDGALLDLSPRWISRVYPAVLIGIAAGLLYGIIGKVNQYSSGSAVVRIEGTEVTARASGTVIATYVEPGQAVSAGELLVQLHDDSESAELNEVLVEYERQLGTFLFDPGSDQAKSSLATIAARRQRAKQVLDARAIRAPRDGVVSDLRVRVGTRLDPGGYILTVVSPNAMPTMIALLPGTDRPRIRPGMTLQFKIPGYEKTNEKIT
ncbi:MAG TPA: HlyD family efflux transporter periplasmic adaptor subunit, partial [Kofleriaceae bacterium]|nr:HlyD family efflux transporter periplasmic adaptor subunit [Kofleriaceae bacterium]